MGKKERLKYYQNHIDELLSDDKFNPYIICQIDTLFELFNLPIDEIDEDFNDVEKMILESTTKMINDFNINNL